MFCGKCGKENVDGAGFCIHCGSDLSRLTPGPTDTLDRAVTLQGTDSGPQYDTLDEAATTGGQASILADQYRIVKKIGEGGMGVVYLAEDTEMRNRPVAIKVLPPLLAKNRRAVENLRGEAITAIKLSHPNIVRLYGFHSDGNIKFLVMEYIDGVTLEEKIFSSPTKKIDFDEAIKIAEQIAKGLDYAHSQHPPVIHRDLKSSNVMIDKNGNIKVLDFGIAREIHDSYTTITGKGDTSGTLPYMSPEQIRGQRPAPSMDIYSLGIICYECLNGKVPFHTGKIDYQIIHEKPALIEGVPDYINDSIQKMLAKDSGKRPKTAEELIGLLKSKPKPKVAQAPPKAVAKVAPKQEEPSIKREPQKPEPAAAKVTEKPVKSRKGLWVVLVILVAGIITVIAILQKLEANNKLEAAKQFKQLDKERQTKAEAERRKQERLAMERKLKEKQGTKLEAVRDDFEDGVIDTSLWIVGGSKGGWNGAGAGNGRWFNDEISSKDGYLQARATTPATGNTYGSQAWTTTVHNFNDGRSWLINFKWEADIQTIGKRHADMHGIEITDGRINWDSGFYIHHYEKTGTKQLYWSNGEKLYPSKWSIYIDSTNRTATLYEGPDGTGTIHSTKVLDKSLPWYLRFITAVGTSSGFPAKDCSIKLYSFSASRKVVENIGQREQFFENKPLKNVSSKGLIAYWSFDTSGRRRSCKDNSGNGNYGIVKGAKWVKGISGQALSFDGSGDYVGMSNNSNLSFTSPSEVSSTSFWIKPNSVIPGDQTILENEDDYLIYLAGGALGYSKTDSGNKYHNTWQSTNPEISARNWSHVVVTYDGTGSGGTKMYVNGEEKPVSNGSYHGGGSASGDNFSIGIRAFDFASAPYGGEIDEVRIYNRALSHVEIQNLYEMYKR